MFSKIKTEINHWRRKNWSFSDVAIHWDATEDYDDINNDTYSYFRRFTDGLRLSNIPNNAVILDICARTGNGTTYFYQNEKVSAAICADVSEKMGKICVQRIQEAGLEKFLWVPIQDYTLPFSDEAFDAVLCFETVEHFPQPDRLINELGRVIRSNGMLVLTTPNVLWEPVHAIAAVSGFHHSEGPHRFIPYGRLKKYIRDSGFKIEKSETTVLIPGGPQFLINIGEWIEKRTRKTIMPLLGLRRIIIGRK